MGNPRFLSTVALCAILFAFGVIALGALTRLIDAGLGCPDWPGCYGHLVVPLTEQARALATIQYPSTPLIAYKAWAEMIHRYFVGGLSLFIVSLVMLIFCKKIYRTRANICLAVGIIALLCYQIILGQLTVTLKLLPIIVTQHLLGGFLILSILWLMYLNNRVTVSQDIQPASKVLLPWSIMAFILVFIQITLGAWTSTNYASLSCSDFPFCQNTNPFMPFYFKEAFNLFAPIGINYEGGVLPEVIRQTIQMTHRVGALILTCYLFILTFFALFKLNHTPSMMRSLYAIIGLLCIQVCIGITNVIFKLPLIPAILHNLVAVLLLLSVITFTFKLAVTQKVSA